LEKFSMKKTLIALAAVAVSTAAMAQVTVYGVVDQGYNTDKKTAGSTVTETTGFNAIQSGGRLGFRGTEEIGSLKASFVIEMGLTIEETGLGAAAAASAANTGLSNRQSFMSLAGGFGSVSIGRQYTLIHGIQGAFDANGNATAAGWLAGLTNSARANDMVAYTSPAIAGFTVQAAMGLDGSETSSAPGATKAGDVQTFGVTYANGPLQVRAVTESIKMSKLAVALPGAAAVDLSNALADRDAVSFGASYDLGMAKLAVLSTKAEAGTDADAGEVNTTNFSVTVPMGALTLTATASNGDYKDSGAAKVDLSGYMLGASYAFSKRTNAYAFVGEAKNKATTAGKHETMAVGLRHSF
jgi:predicted porin